MTSTYDALVVGAGPAGLATSAALSRAGVPHVVLERGDQIGQTWANLYDSLVLHTARGLSALPGLRFPASTPLFPPRREFLAYLQRYASAFRLPIETHAEVTSLQRTGGIWTAHTTARLVQARTVVVATGIVSNPYVPEIAGRARFGGRILHSAEYRRPEGFEGQRVLVVGAGNSAGEISVELARAGANVTLAVRTGALVIPREMAGIPIQYFAVALAALPRSAQQLTMAMMGRVSRLVRGPAVFPAPPSASCPHVPLIGFHLADAVRGGTIRYKKGGVTEFTSDGARFADDSEEPFDAVILATGYRAAVGMVRDLIRLDDCGFALRRNRVISVDQPGLYVVGHNYDIRGGLFNIGHDARLAAAHITARLRDTSRTPTETRPRPSERRSESSH